MARLKTALMVFVVGLYTGTKERVVSAADNPAVTTGIVGTGIETQLFVYDQARNIIFIYQGVAGGGAPLRCSYMLHLHAPSGPIERTNCRTN